MHLEEETEEREDQGFWQCHLLIGYCSDMIMGYRSLYICFPAFQISSTLSSQSFLHYPQCTNMALTEYESFFKYWKALLLHINVKSFGSSRLRERWDKYPQFGDFCCLNFSLLHLATKIRSELNAGFEGLPSSISFTDVFQPGLYKQGWI